LHDEHVGLGPACDVGRHRAEQSPGDGAQPNVANYEQIGVDFLGQIDQCVDRRANDGLLFDVAGPGSLRPVPRLPQDGVDRRVACHLVALVLEHIGGALILALREVRGRDDHLGTRPCGDLAGLVHRAQ
jgi:hypothetical protein